MAILPPVSFGDWCALDAAYEAELLARDATISALDIRVTALEVCVDCDPLNITDTSASVVVAGGTMTLGAVTVDQAYYARVGPFLFFQVTVFWFGLGGVAASFFTIDGLFTGAIPITVGSLFTANNVNAVENNSDPVGAEATTIRWREFSAATGQLGVFKNAAAAWVLGGGFYGLNIEGRTRAG